MMLLIALAFGYLLFFHAQSQQQAVAFDPAKPVTAAGANQAVHSQYKAAMDRADAAAKAMQAERKEADSY